MRGFTKLVCGLALWSFAAPTTVADSSMPVAKYKATFTAPPKEIPSTLAVDAPLLGNGDTLVALGGSGDKLEFYLNKNDLWIMKPREGSHPVALCRLDVELPALKGASYRVEQDLLRAVTTGRFTKDDKTLVIETAVAATENLLWVKLSAEGGAIAGRTSLVLPGQPMPPAPRGKPDEPLVQVVERRFESAVMTPAGAAAALRVLGGFRSGFTVNPGHPVILAVVVRSRFDTKDFREAAGKRAAELREADLATLRTAHEAWWRDFWGQSFVEIPDKVLEQRYYLSHYVLASASREPDFPPGIYGWVTTDNPMWCGDYHMNYNHVAAFYGLYAANHLRQADPCHEPILAAFDLGHQWSLKECGIKGGILLPVGLGPKGSIADRLLHGQRSNSAYACVPLAFRWYATYDLDFAKKAYPFVRDTAAFWEQALKLENGRYVVYKDAIHEGSGPDVNSLLTLGLLRQVLNLALDMSSDLGVDAERRAKWIDMRDRLSDYPACKVRDLPRQFWPKHLLETDATRELPIFRYTEKGLLWNNGNTLGIQHIYPAGGIGLDSKPELLERARNQVHVMARWTDGNGMNSFYPAAARVGYDPAVILKEMRAMLEKMALPNGMIVHNPHGMEHQSIVPNTIQEMLLQSHEGVLRLFPCWPRELDARFATLRARGAFLVTAALKGGKATGVRIVSEKGRACPVVNPWPDNQVQLIRNGNPAERVSGDRFTFKTAPGETIDLRP